MIDVKTKVHYYISPAEKNPFNDFLNSLSPSQQSKILRVFVHLETYGLQQIIPHIRKLIGTPFWEIRILGKDNIRVVFVAPFKNFILVLHGFVKKTRKTPSKEIGISYSRYNEWINRKIT
ncbi:hypothetical protein COY13_02780 [Candidatus Roizmanbacteria bacterium CG_4_10_14_0_2_um_filter_36_35]|uniref:Type II toxin-antitoxin system RelE/ParE family toxin n=4 Tax=Candidatus Roizmaniibacteriota TaxID=1752723 RepID=A0A2M7BVT9_9BACT|nr:MAG: hypothetical protein COV86_03105 [Candidatus Roizmanbacteria bacterium CG11_big_fil_rev_8_21_14_0_20_35_14]PIV10674.1 MAG: hypothetical protein COS50_04240 [Candidatus Roizmanbacteria bacterium CG03_land_8_20_14_0_80_35_26]PIZ67628.1 MAG: hypothetical protein COY13_02780 [Candidatus Roizmanbacteria bacterium CG_4_10_14_0_2_um_filter_36_35]PJC32174.1 MAG: hypothetical protein CO049_03335 [Candidatus Roizmanbacteria bacterium CG_4_9_14_0_2_um_filter_36_12]